MTSFFHQCSHCGGTNIVFNEHVAMAHRGGYYLECVVCKSALTFVNTNELMRDAVDYVVKNPGQAADFALKTIDLIRMFSGR